jgi:hypothetical protein
MDIAEARSALSNQLGLTADESALAGDAAGDVFSQGFGESLTQVNDAIGGIHTGIGDLSSFTEDELEDMSQKALGLAKTFEVDVTEATGAVGQLMKTGLVKDANEGFDLITKTLQGIPAELRDDLLPTVQEYSTQFRRIGLDGQTSMGLLSQAVQAGARDLDQVADGLGQFGERALAGGAEVEEAFKSIGLDAKEMSKLMNQGGKSAEKALQMTTDALRGTESETTKLNAAAALFGDPANVMGEALFALDPAAAAASAGLDKTAGASDKLTEHMKADPAQQMDAAMRQFQQTLGEALLPILLKVSHFMAEHEGLMKILIPVVIGLGIAFGIFAIAVWAVNAAMAANPITWIILGIIALIAVVALIIIKWDEIKESTKLVWGYIGDKIGGVLDWITKKASEFWAWFTGLFSDGWGWLQKNVFDPIGRFFTQTLPGWVDKGLGWVEDKWNDAISFFAGIPGRIASGARGMWNFVTDGLKSALNGAIGLVNSGIWFINDKLISNANRLPGVSIPYIPYIPFLADGGITTGPTLAMIGEGSEQEAVLPLSKLEQLISVGGGAEMRAPSVSKMEPARMTVSYEAGGGDSFTEWLMETIRVRFDGDVNRLGEEGR